MQTGACDYLTKPLNLSRLEHAIRSELLAAQIAPRQQ
jgi:DNA-binding response OmpR family regulator